MIKKVIKKAHALLRPSFATIHSTSADAFNALTKKSVPVESEKSTDALNELLYVAHAIKNSETVKTGEYEALTRLYTGQKIYVDTRDVSESPHLMLDGKREMGISKFFEKIATDGMNYYDVGANFGYNTLLVGKALQTSGSLHLFEANPDLIGLLEKTMSVNGYTSIATINNVAVTEKDGKTVTLHRYKDLWGGSSLHTKEEMGAYRPIDVEFDKEYDVKSISLDGYFKKNPTDTVDFVKIDVEGFEDKVYEGMKNLIKRPEIKVVLEFTFGAYKDEEAFFNTILADFEHVYFVSDQDGKETKVTSIEEVKELSESEWAMLYMHH